MKLVPYDKSDTNTWRRPYGNGEGTGCWGIDVKTHQGHRACAVHIQLETTHEGPKYILNAADPDKWQAHRVGPAFDTLDEAVMYCEMVERAKITLHPSPEPGHNSGF
jgi:hypothetical protein